MDETYYMLVSDSNEVSGQYDSKRLANAELLELAQSHLFNKYLLALMQTYLLQGRFEAESQYLSSWLDDIRSQFDDLKDGYRLKLKFRPVDGQVVFLDAEKVESSGQTPYGYLQQHWDMTQGFSVEQLKDCMLRGVPMVKSKDVQKPSNSTVNLTSSNVPCHRHHSFMTFDAEVQSLSTSGHDAAILKGSRSQYDVLKDEFPSGAGMDKNEMDGTMDEFSVMSENDSSEPHPNLPALKRYYVFVFNKVG